METIFAQATAPGRAGVAIIRVSGEQAFDISQNLCKIPTSNRPCVRSLCDSDDNLIDRALVLRFDKGASFTGEDVIEFHVHGGLATVSKLLSELSFFSNCRLAEPGEFTRRALHNGCLDLNQVEALSDLIDAETEAQRRQAIKVLDGSFSDAGVVWRRDLLRAISLLEASIDFSDEEIPDNLYVEVSDLVGRVGGSISEVLSRSEVAFKIRSGFTVAIVGAPNVGKSTLLNNIAGRQAAITSDVAGTTRDVLEIRIDLNGLPVTFLDTAGLRETEDKVENLGISMAYARATEADLRIFLVSSPDEVLKISATGDDLVVLNKSDLRDVVGISVSGKTGDGVPKLLELISNRFESRTVEDFVAIRQRQIDGLQAALASLKETSSLLARSPVPFELAAQELYFSLSSLDFVFGKVDIESVLDEIFSSFCLGK